MSKQVQAQKFTLSGSGISASATSISLVTLATPDGVAITMTDFGSDVGYATLEPATQREESISFTGITGTTLTGVSRGLRFVSPFDVVAGNKKAHAGGTVMVFSNTSAFYSRFVDDFNAQTIAGIKTFSSIPVLPASDPTTANQAARKAYVDTKVSLTGNETIAGVKTFTSTDIAKYNTHPTFTLDEQIIDKKYADDLAFAGAPDASTTAKGIVEEATQAEVNAGTATGGTGARLYVNPSTLSFTVLASDGSDGDVTINSGTTTLTRDMYYNNLTVNGTGTLVTAGFRVFVQGLTTVDTSGGGGGIQHKVGNGGNGANGSGTTGGAGGTAGTITTSSVMIGSALSGKAGGAGGNVAANGTNGTAGDASTFNLNANAGGAGGAGGGDGVRAGGTAGTGGASSSGISIKPRDIVTAPAPYVFTSATAIQRANITAGSGSGGGGAGGSGGTAGGGGGGSGATGGYLFLATTQLAITGTGAVNVNGGNGGNGGDGTNTGTGAGGGGGGAGGNGGVAVVIYYSKTGTGTITANGGTAGTGGVGYITGLNGASGAAGTAGLVIEITV